MGEYRFVTTWTISASVERVWTEVGDPVNWATYWTGLEDVRPLAPGTPPSAGAAYRLSFKSALPYTLSLTARIAEYEEPRRMVLVTDGELEGRAEFVVEEQGDATRTRLTWTTRTTKPWMNALAFLLGGLFEWNHDVLMRHAGRGLAQRMGADLVQAPGTAPSLPRALVRPALAMLCLVVALRRLRH